MELIKAYAQRMGAANVTPVQADGTAFNPEFEGAFDTVLCDVPCSGTGVINENPDIKLFRKESDIFSLNDSVVCDFLRLHPEYALIKPNSPLEHRETKYGLQFLPQISLGAGFYLTSFKKE